MRPEGRPRSEGLTMWFENSPWILEEKEECREGEVRSSEFGSMSAEWVRRHVSGYIVGWWEEENVETKTEMRKECSYLSQGYHRKATPSSLGRT
eukprot:1377290-Amorphochlora_amoeboformis.AAC.1